MWVGRRDSLFSDLKGHTWLWVTLVHSLTVLVVLLATEPLPQELLLELDRPGEGNEVSARASCFDCPIVLFSRPLVGPGLGGINRVLALADMPALWMTELFASVSGTKPLGAGKALLFLMMATVQWISIAQLTQHWARHRGRR